LTFRSVLLLLATGLAATAVPKSASASSIFHHLEMTERVLTEAGWTDEGAIGTVAEASMATDLGRLPPMSRFATQLAMPETGSLLPLVRTLGVTPFSPETCKGFHFNSLYSYSDIANRWEELGTWVDSTCDAIAEMPATERRQTYLVFLGMTFHMVQDFYAHSNWVGLLDPYAGGDFDAGALPTWEELIDDEGTWRELHPEFPVDEAQYRLRLSDIVVRDDEHLGGLQTGSTRHDHFVGLHPWPHRHARGPEETAVHALACRASRSWLERIETRVGTLDAPYLPETVWNPRESAD